MNESPEVQIARMDERLKTVVSLMERIESDRTTSLQWMVSVSERLANVENSLATSAPTISEFTSLKHKVMGAGVLGRWIWGASAALIGWIFGARETLLALFSGSIK